MYINMRINCSMYIILCKYYNVFNPRLQLLMIIVIDNYITILVWRTKGRRVNIFFDDVNAGKVNFIGINDLLCICGGKILRD